MKNIDEAKNVEPMDGNEAVTNSSVLGELQIHENVISSIVRKVVLRQEGISRLSGNNFVDTIGEIVGSRRIQDRAIIVKFIDNGSLELEIKLVIKFGFVLPEVAANVQRNVMHEVETTTGMNVVKVNVTVQDIEEIVEEVAIDDSGIPNEPMVLNSMNIN